MLKDLSFKLTVNPETAAIVSLQSRAGTTTFKTDSLTTAQNIAVQKSLLKDNEFDVISIKDYAANVMRIYAYKGKMLLF